jgi:hypothetical protein
VFEISTNRVGRLPLVFNNQDRRSRGCLLGLDATPRIAVSLHHDPDSSIQHANGCEEVVKKALDTRVVREYPRESGNRILPTPRRPFLDDAKPVMPGFFDAPGEKQGGPKPWRRQG